MSQPAEERLAEVPASRRALILEREAREGVILDALTGYPIHFEAGEAPVEMLPDMVFWLHLDRELVGARNENGFLWPSEVELALDRWGIMDEDNREAAKAMLAAIATGRNMAAMERHKPKKKDDSDSPKPKAKKTD